jgi:hypothetical protein
MSPKTTQIWNTLDVTCKQGRTTKVGIACFLPLPGFKHLSRLSSKAPRCPTGVPGFTSAGTPSSLCLCDMFATTFNNGEYGIEIFSPSGNEPFKACKLNNEQNIRKVYDRNIKGYMVAMEKESSSTSLQFPKSFKGSLMITQPILVLQIQQHPEKPFSVELIIIDSDQQRRRFHLSTNFKDADVNSLHVCLPWTQPDREEWCNVALNMDYLVTTFHTSKSVPSFLNLETLTIQPVCRIRKIFSLPIKYLGDEATGMLSAPCCMC